MRRRQRIRLRCWLSGGVGRILGRSRRVCIRLVGRRRRRRACIRISISIVCPVRTDWCGVIDADETDMGSKGEVRINQAKRGYDVTGDEEGLSWINP